MQPNGAQAQVEPKPGRMDKHGRKRAKEAKQKAKIEERARRHEAKMKKMQERAEAAVRTSRAHRKHAKHWMSTHPYCLVGVARCLMLT